MKKSPLKTSLFVLLILLSFSVQGQKFSGLDKSPLDIASYPSIHDDSNTQIKVIYSRPQLKGRSLNTLVPNDKVWRTGANEATEIIFYKDMKFGKHEIKAGTYTLATIPGEKEWLIILSSGLNVWGAYSYKVENDVARIKVPVGSGDNVVEAFSIAFEKNDDGVDMILAWDTLRIGIPFKN